MRILTLVATYNEAQNIGRLVPEILNHLPATSVLVVDDNSPDGTGDVVRAMAAADSRVEVLTRTHARGYGSAMIEGMQWAVRNRYDALVTLDADFSHDPADMPRLVDALAAADVAIGSRYVGGIRVLNWDVRRLLLSLAANSYIRSLSGLAPVDCTSGFRAYRVAELSRVSLDSIASSGYAFLPELLFSLNGAVIVEVPICYTERRVGESKMAAGIVLEAALRPWMLFGRRVARAMRRGPRIDPT
jgi:dolichol-phosphate mannosyltransferase